MLANEPSDPIITPSSLPGVSSPLQDDNEKPDNSDPIELTPPSQCHPPDTASKAPIANVQSPEKQPLLPDDSFVVEIAKDPPDIATPAKTKSSQVSSLHQGEALPPIQAALKRSSILPANDKTRVCIDINLGKMTTLSKLTSPSHPLNVKLKVNPCNSDLPPFPLLLNLAVNGSLPLMLP